MFPSVVNSYGGLIFCPADSYRCMAAKSCRNHSKDVEGRVIFLYPKAHVLVRFVKEDVVLSDNEIPLSFYLTMTLCLLEFIRPERIVCNTCIPNTKVLCRQGDFLQEEGKFIDCIGYGMFLLRQGSLRRSSKLE